MPVQQDRRAFLGMGLGGLAALGVRTPMTWPAIAAAPPAFPRQEPEVVEEMVGVSHRDLARVKQLVEARPALARAAVDWGFGDWEDALGAASHVGRADIADVLIAHGARPTIFSAAMLGQLDVVKAFVAASPGCQRILGPHSIPLLSHARAGGENARAVREYLEKLGDADGGPPATQLPDADREIYTGTYVFGSGASDKLVVAVEKTGMSMTRPGLPFGRGLRYLGDGQFHPIGAESVRIKFTVSGSKATAVSVYDPGLVVSASRE